MDQPIILCGLGKVGWRVLDYLRAAGLSVVAIDTTCAPNDSRLEKVRLIQGDCRRPETLREAGLAAARGVIILTSDDLINIQTALTVRQLHPELRVVIRMFNQNLLTRLGKAVHNVFALSTSTLTAPLLALTALTGQALGAFRVEGLPEGRRQVAEVTISAGSALRGRTILHATSGREVLVLAHFPSTGAGRFLHDVEPEARLTAGDRLVVCAEPRRLAAWMAEGTEQTAPHVLWAGWLRRTGRVIWRSWAEMDLAVKICTGVLIGAVALSTAIFHWGVTKYSVADAFFRSISVMATMADMHEDDFSAGMKFFVGLLRLLGAALTAAFTAILTNYLLRVRLGGALEIRRIPDSGHVIVCGLGNIGFRVIEELLSYGERVVAIEMSRDNRFVPTARRLGIAVIIGDATVREVLRQANAAGARAVIVTTSDDLVALEIALLVRELNDDQRVVLRLSDPHLAQTLRDAANVRLALSIPTLAAPAFVAALFGDRVQSVFLVEDRMMAVVDLTIQPQDSFLAGQSLRTIAVDYRLLPLAVLASYGKALPHTLNSRLEAGNRLVAIIGLTDLQRLLRRETAPCDWSVEITAIPLPARPWVAQLLRTQRGLSAEEAELAAEKLPVCVGLGLTRGQAEDLLALLYRERVTGRILREEGAPREQTTLGEFYPYR